MIKYRTKRGGDPEIVEVEVECDTKCYVWIGNHMIIKQGNDVQYHDTFEQAKKYLLLKATTGLDEANKELMKAMKRMEIAMGLAQE